MPLSFLNPALLFGMLAAAVPVVIHFLSRRRRRRIEFGDLRFLQAAETRQARRRGLQRWLLLMLRMLIVCCLALAAARPHWGGLPGGGGRAVLFLLDASASMQAQEPDGRSRFEVAVALAGEMMAALPAEASVHALRAGAAAQPIFAAWLPAGPPARAALAGAVATDGPGDLAAALREAARLARSAPARPVEVVLLSDLQAVVHPGLEAAAAELAGAGARLLIHRVGDGVPGGGVLDVRLPGRVVRPGEVVGIEAVVRPERDGQTFWLELDGRRVAEVPATAADIPSGAVTVTFPLAVPEPGLYLGRIGKDPDRLPADDVRPFVLTVPATLRVLLVHGADRDPLGRGGWRYLQRAMDPAGRGDGALRVRSVPADSLLASDLAGTDLLVMVDAGAPGRRLGGVLREWLTGGGGLLLLVGDPTLAEELRESVLPVVGLPRQAEWRARAADQAERAREVDPGHPLVADLDETALRGLATIRWHRYFAVAEGEARVVLASDAGAPLLLEGELGAGRWALLPFHLRRDATDLMLHPLFLPLVQRLAARLAAGSDQEASLDVGRPPVLPLPPERLRLKPGDSAGNIEVLLPPRGRPAPATLTWRGAVPVLVGPPAERAGFHVFRAGGDTLGVVPAVVPAAESEPAVLPPAELGRRLRAAGLGSVVDLGDGGVAGLGRALTGRDLTRGLLAAALLLLAFELWYGQRVRSRSDPA